MSRDIKLPRGAAAVLEHPNGAQVLGLWFARSYVTTQCTNRTKCCLELRTICVQVFLVGAAYVSKEAANETKEVITSIQPRCVLLELDKVGQHLAE